MGDLRPRSRGGKPTSAALRGARGLRGLDRLLAATSPRRAGVCRPTSRVIGVGSRGSEEDLRDIVRAMQARRASAAASAGNGGNKEDAASDEQPVKRRGGATPLQRISEDAAVLHPTS